MTSLCVHKESLVLPKRGRDLSCKASEIWKRYGLPVSVWYQTQSRSPRGPCTVHLYFPCFCQVHSCVKCAEHKDIQDRNFPTIGLV